MRKIFYSHSQKAFFDTAISGYVIPDDAVEVSQDYRQELLSSPYGIDVDAAGNPIPAKSPPFNLDEVREMANAQIRAIRKDILDAVTGIGFRSVVSGDSDSAKEASAISKKLLDITDAESINSSETYDEMIAAAMREFRLIESIASDEFKSAFKAIASND